MSIEPPRLDDADALALLEEARRHLRDNGARWQADDPADPGVALLEAFAAITAEELKRLNRLPEALLGQFLKSLGVTPRPGQAAAAEIEFNLSAPRPADTVIPAGLQVTADQPGAPVFALLRDTVIPAGTTSAEGVVAAARSVSMADAGTSNAALGQQVQLPHGNLPLAPDAVATIDLLVHWPVDPPPEAEIVEQGGTRYVRFHEIDGYDTGAGTFCFVADRISGRLRLPEDTTFLPPAGARLLVSYFYMDDMAGADQPALIEAGALSTLLDPAPGLTARNPADCVPPEPAQQHEDLLAQGALSGLLGGLAIRPRDYEEIAWRAHPGIARAHAFTEAEIWRFAEPGKVLVRLVPAISPVVIGPPQENSPRMLWTEALAAARAAPLRGGEMLPAARRRLNAASPLGAAVDVAWMQAKPVGVSALIYVGRGTDHAEMQELLRRWIDAYLSPVKSNLWPQGWPCGRTLRQSELIETLLDVPGVRAVDRVEMRPRYPMSGSCTGLAADAMQSGIWYAALGGQLYVSLNNGDGWTRVTLDQTATQGQQVVSVAAHPVQSGLLAVGLAGGSVWVSKDCARSFLPFCHLPQAEGGAQAPDPRHLAWADGGEARRLLIGGDGPLCESTGPDAEGNLPIAKALVASDGSDVGPIACIATRADGRGGRLVAVARARLEDGVVFSSDSGWDGGFFTFGLSGHDVRALSFAQVPDGALFLVAGCAKRHVAGQSEIWIAPVDADIGELGPWAPARGPDWGAGTVHALAATGNDLIAGVASGGLRHGTLDNDGQITWTDPPAGASLPLTLGHRQPAPIRVIAVAPVPLPSGDPQPDQPKQPPRLAIGGDDVLSLAEPAPALNQRIWRDVTVREGATHIAIPDDWVICGDAHLIEVQDVLE